MARTFLYAVVLAGALLWCAAGLHAQHAPVARFPKQGRMPERVKPIVPDTRPCVAGKPGCAVRVLPRRNAPGIAVAEEAPPSPPGEPELGRPVSPALLAHMDVWFC